MNLIDLSKSKEFDSEEKRLAYLERMRWPEGIRCPSCGNRKISRFNAKGRTGKLRQLYQCLEKSCRYQFSVTTGTIFHDSHLPLGTWFIAISLLAESKESISTNQLRHALGVQYRTAQHVASRVREALRSGTIEIEEPQAPVRLREHRQAVVSGPVFASLEEGHGPLHASTLASRALAEPASRHVSASTHFSNNMGIETQPGNKTTVDNMVSIFTSMAQMTLQPPIFFANYITRFLT